MPKKKQKSKSRRPYKYQVVSYMKVRSRKLTKAGAERLKRLVKRKNPNAKVSIRKS